MYLLIYNFIESKVLNKKGPHNGGPLGCYIVAVYSWRMPSNRRNAMENRKAAIDGAGDTSRQTQ